MIFKENNADKLEERLNKLVDKYQKKINMRSEVEAKTEKADFHMKAGLFSGMGIGATTLAGSVAGIAAFPSIATAAGIGALTVAGTAMMSGGAVLAVGLGYAGISKLYKNYQESRLGGIHERVSEERRLEILAADMNVKFSNKMNKETNYKNSMSYSEVLNIESALRINDIEGARKVIKDVVSEVSFDNEKKEDLKPVKTQIFKTPVAEGLTSRLSEFYDKYQDTANLKSHWNKMNKWENRKMAGLSMAGLGAAYGVAGLVAVGSLPMLGAGVAVGFASLGYTGISALIKSSMESKTKRDLLNEGDKLIEKYSKELDIPKNELSKITVHSKEWYDGTKNDHASKDEFINKIKANKQKI